MCSYAQATSLRSFFLLLSPRTHPDDQKPLLDLLSIIPTPENFSFLLTPSM
jgi:hypothetical protein